MTITMYICTQEDTVMSFITASFDTFESTGLLAELVCCEGKQRCGSRLGWTHVMRKIFIKEHHLITIKARYLEHQSIL